MVVAHVLRLNASGYPRLVSHGLWTVTDANQSSQYLLKVLKIVYMGQKCWSKYIKVRIFALDS